MSKRQRKNNRHRPKQKKDRDTQLIKAGFAGLLSDADDEIVQQVEIEKLFIDFMLKSETKKRPD